MSKELKNIADAVMDKIHQGKIKMRPKAYFVIGSLLAFIGLVFSIITSVFLIGLMRFFLRSHCPIREHKLEQFFLSFPWWIAVVAILGLIIGIWLLRRYDFSYKTNFKVIVVGFIVAIIIAGWFIDMAGLNDILLRRGPMRGMMRQYLEENNIQPGSGCGKWKNNQERPKNE